MNYDILLLFYCTVRVIYFMILTDDFALVRVRSSSAAPSGTRRRKRRTSGPAQGGNQPFKCRLFLRMRHTRQFPGLNFGEGGGGFDLIYRLDCSLGMYCFMYRGPFRQPTASIVSPGRLPNRKPSLRHAGRANRLGTPHPDLSIQLPQTRNPVAIR